jgi:hypothetical protein
MANGDEGSVAAEFAVAMPAVVLVLALCLGALQLGGAQIQLQDAASAAARSVARGGTAPAHPGIRLSIETRGDLVCVALRRTVDLVRLPVEVGARSCALAGGR